MIHVVLGCLYGDEGKGQTVNSLSNPDSLVIRFSGGHQCGHTVVNNGRQHTFSQYGAGTFKRTDTYISEFCTVYPKGWLKEFNQLQNIISVENVCKYYVDPFAMVTTPYDIAFNKVMEGLKQHGSCGVGVGNTVGRNLDCHTLFARDLKVPVLFSHKLDKIEEYYRNKLSDFDILDMEIAFDMLLKDEFAGWEDACYEYCNKVDIQSPSYENYKDLIFEGSQGIMLDQRIGMFPHVTRSNTTVQNVLDFMNRYHINRYYINNNEEKKVHYVTRAYMTRHGNGPFPINPVNLIGDFKNKETNKTNDWQGHFKVSKMDFSLLQHAIEMNNTLLAKSKFQWETELVVTCCDHVENFKEEPFNEMSVNKISFKYQKDWK